MFNLESWQRRWHENVRRAQANHADDAKWSSLVDGDCRLKESLLMREVLEALTEIPPHDGDLGEVQAAARIVVGE